MGGAEGRWLGLALWRNCLRTLRTAMDRGDREPAGGKQEGTFQACPALDKALFWPLLCPLRA